MKWKGGIEARADLESLASVQAKHAPVKWWYLLFTPMLELKDPIKSVVTLKVCVWSVDATNIDITGSEEAL